ncbi:MAG TPA: hypothetical protein VIU41_00335 [Geobacteraceae bacterium]
MIAFQRYTLGALLFSLVLIIAGCGGGSGGGSGGSSPAATTTTISGTVLAGPTAGSTVTVKTAGGLVVATSTAPTDVNGAFTVAIPSSALTSDLVFEASGGTFPDEATASTGVTFGKLTAHVASNTLTAGSNNVTLDPSSTIVQKLVAGGMGKVSAESAFNTAFGFTPDCSVKPAFASISSAATTTQRLAGLRAAVFSQLTKDLGLAADKQFELLQALATDLADGVLDGRNGATAVTTASGAPIPADINNRFDQALMAFLASSSNKSKLTTDKVGSLPFAKTALTDSYKVEYLPGTLAASQGKSSFKIKLTNLSDGTPATGRIVKLMPKMHMASMSHGSPVDPVVVDNGDGTYTCTVYYLMASGAGMGIWELKVMIGTDSAVFYPPVAMAMGSTTRATLKGLSDLIPGMMGGMGTNRTYYLFNEGLAGSTFKLFIAALDDAMMMNYPAVSVGTTLHDQSNAAWTASTMAVELSADNGTTWITATDSGNGHWSATGLTGLASGGTVLVRMTINGEQKSTNGLAVAGANGSASFTIAAGM